MKKLMFSLAALALVVAFSSDAFAGYKYIIRRDTGTGYWRDTSNDGNPYNNANYLGLND